MMSRPENQTAQHWRGNNMIQSFLNYAGDCGVPFILSLGDVETDGEIHRVDVNGDRRGSKNGWYVYHDALKPFAVFGSWKQGSTHVWSAESVSDMNREDKIKFLCQVNENKAKSAVAKERAHRAAEKEALTAWIGATPAVNVDSVHRYLENKMCREYGLRIAANGDLIVPVFNGGAVEKITSLQTITAAGRKMFLRDGRIKGGYYRMDGEPSDNGEFVIIAEGYATAATIREHTGRTVYCCFNAGNIPDVARAVKARHRASMVVIAADNDHATNGNPGMTKADEGAKACGGIVVAPRVEDVITIGCKPVDDIVFNFFGTDWNDLWQEIALSGIDDPSDKFRKLFNGAINGKYRGV